MTAWVLVVVGVFLTVGTAVFVAAEFALVALEPSQVDEKSKSSKRIRRALSTLSTQLSGAQLGITITTILLGYTAQPALTEMLGLSLESTPLARAAVGGVAAAISLVLINVFSMIIGELVPKNAALSEPLKVARLVVPLILAFTFVLKPLIAVMNGSANAILRLMGIEPKEELAGGRSPQELAALVRRSAEAGTLAPSTALLLKNTIDLDALSAIDVMTDRTRMHVLERTATAMDVMVQARASGHSRFPIIGESHDDVLGIVHVTAAVGVKAELRETTPVTEFMVPAAAVPETMQMRPLLIELRALPIQMAMVVDEYGGTAGVVTFEDVVEELVGEVADEHDRRRVEGHRMSDGAWSLPGVLRPDEVHEATRLVIPESPAYETLGGFVMEQLGRVAEPGDIVTTDTIEVRVERMEGRRVDRVRVRELPRTEDDS